MRKIRNKDLKCFLGILIILIFLVSGNNLVISGYSFLFMQRREIRKLRELRLYDTPLEF